MHIFAINNQNFKLPSQKTRLYIDVMEKNILLQGLNSCSSSYFILRKKKKIEHFSATHNSPLFQAEVVLSIRCFLEVAGN
jgi:hypothetical protein